MKKLIVFSISFLLILGFSRAVFALAQSVATPTDQTTQQQIDELQSKIASKVAELNLVEKKGVLGTVTDSSDTEITLNDVNGNIDNIDVDELTKFYSSKPSFGISDVKKGATLGILGLYNKDSGRILAREVNDLTAPETIILGIITKVDRVNYELTLSQNDGKKVVFEIEDTTKTYSYFSNLLTRSGFSKTTEQTTAIAVGNKDPKNPSKFLTDRIILLPEITFPSLSGTTLPTVFPSTASAKPISK